MEFLTTEMLQRLLETSVAVLVLIAVIIALVIVALLIRQRIPIEKNQSDAEVAQANSQAAMAVALTKTSEAQLKSAESMMTNAQTLQKMVEILARIDVNADRAVQGLRIINAKLDYLRVMAERNGNGGKVNGLSNHSTH